VATWESHAIPFADGSGRVGRVACVSQRGGEKPTPRDPHRFVDQRNDDTGRGEGRFECTVEKTPLLSEPGPVTPSRGSTSSPRGDSSGLFV
jgi:hypothetical protein